MRVVVDDDELKALVPLLDELILKKTALLGARLPTGLDEIAGITATAKEETEATIDVLEAGLDGVQAEAAFIETYVETVVNHAAAQIVDVQTNVQTETAFIEAYVEAVISRATAQIVDVRTRAEFTEDYIETVINQIATQIVDIRTRTEFTRDYTETVINQLATQIIVTEQAATAISKDALLKLFEVEMRTKTLQEHVRDLPNIDRATRMILLKIPGLREALRLLYIIKMEERTMRLGQVVATAKAAEIDVGATIAKLSGGLAVVESEALVVEASVQATINRLTAEIAAAEARASAGIASIRGPVTAAITLLIYAMMANQWLQNRQDRMQAQLDAMKREMDQRYITIEEALRGYDGRPEKYRATVAP